MNYSFLINYLGIKFNYFLIIKKVIFSLVFLLSILSSCNIHKRYHRNGFTVNWNKTQTIHKKQKQSVVERKSGDSTSRKAIDLNRSFYSFEFNSLQINKDEQQKLNILEGTPKLYLVENSLKNTNLQKGKIERLSAPVFQRKLKGLVAQLNSAPDYGSGGFRFES